MAGGTRSGGPQEFAVFRGDRHVVDACFPAAHQSIAIEFPLLVAVRAKPIAGIIAPLILEANTDAVFIERPMNWTPWDHGGFDLRCTLACPCPSKIKPLLAASACAVGMWATRLRCPSEAAYPQLFAPPRFYPCRRATPPSASGCSSPDGGAENCKRSSKNRCRPAPRGRQRTLSDAPLHT